MEDQLKTIEQDLLQVADMLLLNGTFHLKFHRHYNVRFFQRLNIPNIYKEFL